MTNERGLGKRLPNEKHQQTSLINVSPVYLVFDNTTVAKRNNTFLGLDWPAIYSSLKNSASDTKLKWFQYRILHRVLTTNDYLYKKKGY